MSRYAFAWLVWGLALGLPTSLSGQEPEPSPAVELLQNYPNPFNPATTVPFRVSERLFRDGHRPLVSLRIYNVLPRLVAVPILQGSGQRLDGVQLECREVREGYCEFSAYWDGRVLDSDREAASGVYIYQLVVDGYRVSRRMVVMK